MTKTELHTEVQPLAAVELTANHENAIITRFVASRRNYLLLKRTIDIVVSLLLILLVFSWLFPLIAAWIWLASRGPVFFTQVRVGRNEKLFRCFKFRTMVINPEADEKPADTNDARITTPGRFLRRTNLDELPQLFNVLAGDMSLTGPRPHMLADHHRFSYLISSYKFRTLVRPGITGLAQIKGYHGPARDYESIANRYYWDAVYVRKANAVLDLKILLKTLWMSIRRIFIINY